jgi:energy-coupling factor transporter ATP-binding protein EcfA2
MLVDRPTTVVPQPLRGELQFDGVSFSYEGGRPALTDVSLAIPAGERVAIVGRSGAGKSTLAALAARFYDPATGRVLIDGTDARDYPLTWLRGQVGLVLQDAVLFTGSVADNIGWGIDAAREDVVRAAKLVGADGFIEQLPEGYDTPLDPAGAGLSGGQRQRIAIARTLLRDPALLLLDEPTTGLDVESEAEVLGGLDILMRGRTTIIISHALALAQRADQVVVLEDGRVVQAGPPSEVLGRHGPFRDLVAEQAPASDPERAPRAQSSAPPIADPRLPQARLLLDTSAVAPMLERSFDRGTRLDVGIRYLRYKPGTNLMVHYDVAVNGHRYDAVGMIAAGESLGRRAQAPESVALAQLVGARVEAASPMAYDRELGTLFQWYPLDLALPALALPPSELRRQMSAAGVPVPSSGEEPERLAYKPRRRAVLRVDGHVVKLYRRPAEFELALAGQQAASTLDTLPAPRLEAAMPEHLVTVQSLLEGVTPDAADVTTAAGDLLSRLHRSEPAGLPVFEPRSQLAAAAASARLVWTIAPELRPRLERLLEALAAGMPDIPELVPSHGDFNARQLLVMGDGQLALTDFDEFCLAPAALDPATFAAYFVLGQPVDLASARLALDELCRGYGGRPPHLAWYFATMILRRSARPFRYFEADWPPRVEAMVAAAEEVAAADDIAAIQQVAGR